MHKSAYSPAQFCDQHGIAKTTFYALLKDGRGPRTFKVGRRTLISAEAACEWRKRMEDETSEPCKSFWEHCANSAAKGA